MTLRAFIPLALLAFSLPAQDSDLVALQLKSKETLHARVLGVQGDKASLRISMMGGEATVKRKLADFMPDSQMTIHTLANKTDTIDAHWTLAKQAASLGLIKEAGRELRAAVKVAEKEPDGKAKITAIEQWAAVEVSKLFDKALASKDLEDARHYLKILATRLADHVDEEKLAQHFDRLLAAERSAEAEQETGADQKVREASESVRSKEFAAIYKQVDAADKHMREGLKNARRTVTAVECQEKAIEDYRSAWKATQKLVKENESSDAIQEEAARLSQRIKSSAIQSALHASNALVLQSNYRKATEWANKILTVDPQNAEAKEMIRTIQLADAAASGEWRWGWQSGR